VREGVGEGWGKGREAEPSRKKRRIAVAKSDNPKKEGSMAKITARNKG